MSFPFYDQLSNICCKTPESNQIECTLQSIKSILMFLNQQYLKQRLIKEICKKELYQNT